MITIQKSKLRKYERKKLEDYYGSFPDFTLYRLKEIKELKFIEEKDFVRFVENKEPRIYQKCSSFFECFKGVFYIVISKDIDLFHEISHLVFYFQLTERFKKEDDSMRRYIDEIIAEYNFTKITCTSKYLPEINRGRTCDPKNMPYHIGVCWAMPEIIKDNNYKKVLQTYISRFSRYLSFTNNIIKNLDLDGIKKEFNVE